MTGQEERLIFLLHAFLSEQPAYAEIDIPASIDEQKKLLRALMNVRPPLPLNEEILRVQNVYLQEEIASRGITDCQDLRPIEDNICLWQGDITTLKCGAIVNAANSAMRGCFVPGHHCIDNAIHSIAGVQLRLACAQLMEKQGHVEEAGGAKITPAFNLPAAYVLHTVGPYIIKEPSSMQCSQLSSCYRACLDLASKYSLSSVAFCCISTGEFHFPPLLAAQIALDTVRQWLKDNNSSMRIIFNVYKDSDYDIYRRLWPVC